MSKSKTILIAAVVAVIAALSGVVVYVALNRENPETIREMKQVDETQDNLDDYLGGLE